VAGFEGEQDVSEEYPAVKDWCFELKNNAPVRTGGKNTSRRLGTSGDQRRPKGPVKEKKGSKEGASTQHFQPRKRTLPIWSFDNTCLTLIRFRPRKSEINKSRSTKGNFWRERERKQEKLTTSFGLFGLIRVKEVGGMSLSIEEEGV